MSVYEYETNLDYKIKVTKIDIDVHIDAEPMYVGVNILPTVSFINKDIGTIDFPSKSIIPLDNIDLLKWMENALKIHSFIAQNFEKLSRGENYFFGDKDNELDDEINF